MSETIRQHFVPQFYLKQFEDNSGFLHVYDKLNKHIFKCRSKDICQEKNLYETPWENASEKLGKKVLSNDFEHFFSRKEGKFSQVISKILSVCSSAQNKNALICKSEEKKLLAEFIVNLYVRNPWTMAMLQLNEIPKDLDSNQEIQIMRQMFSRLGFGSLNSMIIAAQKKAYITDEFGRGFCGELTQRLCNVDLSFFYSDDSAFVTSSFPTGFGEDSSAVGFEKISNFLSLSPNVAVMFGNFNYIHKFKNRMTRLSKDIVMEFNQIFFSRSTEQVRYIICHNSSLLEELMRQKKSDGSK